jgi:hypothetical protein
MISRRSFLLGLGGLVTTSFVTRTTSHIAAQGAPLLLDPGRAEETLYVYDFGVCSGEEGDGFKWRVSLGPDIYPAPPPPTWRDYLAAQDARLDSQADLDRLRCEHSLASDELDDRIDGYQWESLWVHYDSPQAKAAIILKELNIDCSLDCRGRKAGLMDFVDWGGHPGSCARWVDLRDDLTVSLLQARLIELSHPIKIVIGDFADV